MFSDSFLGELLASQEARCSTAVRRSETEAIEKYCDATVQKVQCVNRHNFLFVRTRVFRPGKEVFFNTRLILDAVSWSSRLVQPAKSHETVVDRFDQARGRSPGDASGNYRLRVGTTRLYLDILGQGSRTRARNGKTTQLDRSHSGNSLRDCTGGVRGCRCWANQGTGVGSRTLGTRQRLSEGDGLIHIRLDGALAQRLIVDPDIIDGAVEVLPISSVSADLKGTGRRHDAAGRRSAWNQITVDVKPDIGPLIGSCQESPGIGC